MAWFKSLLPKGKTAQQGKGSKPEKLAELPKRRKPKRPLSAEDHALWSHITQSITPMPGRKTLVPAPVPEPERQESRPADLSILHAEPSPKPRALPPLAGVERRMVKEVARGHRAIEGRIDLHGMRQAEAHGALVGFIHRAHAADHRLVLVITGKGGGTDAGGDERGVLRRMVPHWLADPVLRRMVVGFENAARNHGGEGALYVRLRRRKSPE